MSRPVLLLAIHGNSERFSKIKKPTVSVPRPLSLRHRNTYCRSVICGVLEIYGTTSYLTKYYWIVGVTLILTGLLLYLSPQARRSSENKKRKFTFFLKSLLKQISTCQVDKLGVSALFDSLTNCNFHNFLHI